MDHRMWLTHSMPMALALCVACGGSSAKTESDTSATDHDVQGLQLAVSTESHVAGIYRSGDVALHFDLSSSGTKRHAVFTTVDGNALLDSSLTDRSDQAQIYGDQLVVRGSIDNATPDIVGNATLLSELQASPEYQLVPSLKAALHNRGVDKALYVADDAVNDQPLAQTQQLTVAIWSFWGVSRLVVSNESNSVATYQILRGKDTQLDSLSSGSRNGYASPWTGLSVQINNQSTSSAKPLTVRLY